MKIEMLKRGNVLSQNLAEEIRGPNRVLEINVNLLLENVSILTGFL